MRPGIVNRFSYNIDFKYKQRVCQHKFHNMFERLSIFHSLSIPFYYIQGCPGLLSMLTASLDQEKCMNILDKIIIYIIYVYMGHSVLIWTLNQRASLSWQMKMAFVVDGTEFLCTHADIFAFTAYEHSSLMISLMKSLWWELTDCRVWRMIISWSRIHDIFKQKTFLHTCMDHHIFTGI